MQAIATRYLPATNTRGSRIKAHCERGSIIIPYPCEAGQGAHRVALKALLDKFDAEDIKRFGTPGAQDWGRRKWAGGALPQNNPDSYAFVIVTD